MGYVLYIVKIKDYDEAFHVCTAFDFVTTGSILFTKHHNVLNVVMHNNEDSFSIFFISHCFNIAKITFYIFFPRNSLLN